MRPPIDTGQQFPQGMPTETGTCDQCLRRGEVVNLRLMLTAPNTAQVRIERFCCAECMADFICAPLTAVYARNADGLWQRLERK